MEILEAIFLGIIQGLAEFLPISSSGHLIIIPKIFGMQDQGLAFDVALHVGTLMAILIYFWNDWKKIFSESYFLKQLEKIFVDRKRELFDAEKIKKDKLFIIIIATIPGVLAGLFLEDYAESIFRNPLSVGLALFVGAMFLFIVDKKGKKNLEEKNITLKIGMIIGLFQALAIIPGMSRSGITITAALLLGLDRAASARFSFLLATPIILGAAVKEYPAFMASLDASLLAGVLSAFISGYFAIKYMLRYLEKRSYDIFVIYRILLSLAVFSLFA